MEECADGEADREGGTSRSPVWAWLTLWSCALGGRASADGAVKTGLRAFGQTSQLDRDATGKQKVEKSGLFGFVWVWFVSFFFLLITLLKRDKQGESSRNCLMEKIVCALVSDKVVQQIGLQCKPWIYLRFLI